MIGWLLICVLVLLIWWLEIFWTFVKYYDLENSLLKINEFCNLVSLLDNLTSFDIIVIENIKQNSSTQITYSNENRNQIDKLLEHSKKSCS